jgi:hypothetical protein
LLVNDIDDDLAPQVSHGQACNVYPEVSYGDDAGAACEPEEGGTPAPGGLRRAVFDDETGFGEAVNAHCDG